MAQAAHVLERFDAHILFESGIFRVNPAGENKILPDENAVAVAQVIKAFFLVEPAAPDAQHVHMGGRGVPQQLLHIGVADAGGK